MIKKDLLWKSIIEDFFEDFLHFFYSEFVEDVDFAKPFEFLDKELQTLQPEADSQHRRADLLVKVYLLNGEEKWILVHIEVQGYEDVNFPLRMFIYNYRSFDKFNKPISAIAILTDDKVNYRPTFYEQKTWRTTMRYDFDTYKVLDYPVSHFDTIDNPFSVVMKTVRLSIKNKSIKTDEDLLSLKLSLFKNMLGKGYSKQVIRKMTNFIKHYILFKDKSLYRKFDNSIEELSQNNPPMGILELVQREAVKEAKEEGKEELKIEMIEKLLSKGLSIEKVVFLMDESEDFVLFVQKQMEQKEAIKELLVKEWNDTQIIEKLEVSTKLIATVKEEMKENNNQSDL
ncbi:MAG: hypothetical protein ACPG19_11160 [Saprospiraceae bacterium]